MRVWSSGGKDGDTERRCVVESEMEVKLALKLWMSNDRVAGLVAGRELNATLRAGPGLSSPRLVNSLPFTFDIMEPPNQMMEYL